jgi:cAMP-binding proteins - catabolite gene activator and regulatory subunit of cAMP-dependent protein kinases
MQSNYKGGIIRMEQYLPVIRKCSLFRNIRENELGPLIQCLGAKVKKYKAEEYIFLSGDEINNVGLVLTGIVEIMKENLAGNKHIVAFLEPADIFAEGIVCTVKRISPVTVRAKEDVQILMIPYERIIKSCGNACAFHISLIKNMMVILGEKNVILNRKLELLTLKGMREKLASYLLNEANNQGSSMFQIVLNRSELADYLNVSRTSMCRELARMKEEGFIDFYGSSFKIIDKNQLAKSLEVL